MRAIEIARRMAELGKDAEARMAYALSLREDVDPAEKLEAACCILQSGGDYKIAYLALVELYRAGEFREDILDMLTNAFYTPNSKQMKSRYEKNVKLLGKYKYMFRRDFPKFEELPIQFFPFDDNSYIPYDRAEEQFGEHTAPRDPVIRRNYFADLEKPVLATDVYSQYELEYLRDQVRPSEWVGRENHLYLHYTNWGEFCSWLQVLNLRPILEDSKAVFLIGDEVEQYPIDFKARFGIDYSVYPVKPIHVREVTKLIWHTQLATHNGGDFFNEIFHGHPNLLPWGSIMLDKMNNLIENYREAVQKYRSASKELSAAFAGISTPTDKDLLVGMLMFEEGNTPYLDPAARIAPAVFFQPHFSNMTYNMSVWSTGRAMLHSEQYEAIKASPMFRSFPYIKTFTPMRRLTNSYGATARFIVERQDMTDEERIATMDERMCLGDYLYIRAQNRSYLIGPDDRLYRDSRLVRFEDGKLNPKATFTALAAFLDVPYTESMTYCSSKTGLNPESLRGNDRGFDPAAIYRTYDDYATDDERAYLEYFFRDVYEHYGYDFHYYKGETVDEEWVKERIAGFTIINKYITQSWIDGLMLGEQKKTREEAEKTAKDVIDDYNEKRLELSKLLLNGLYFVNKNGQPLRMMTPLKLDPALLEQPLYH